MKKLIIITLVLAVMAFGVSALDECGSGSSGQFCDAESSVKQTVTADAGIPDAGVLPTSSFYGFKTSWEKIRLAFAFSKEKKALVRAEIAERRLAEAITLESLGETEKAEATLEKYKQTVSQLEPALGGTGDGVQSQNMLQVQARYENAERIRKVYEGVPVTVEPTLSKPTPTLCSGGITSAVNKVSGRCEIFPSKCIPEGWMIVKDCKTQDKIEVSNG